MSIENKISNLSSDNLSKLNDELLDRLYDRQWCFENGINYVDPNVSDARQALYSELFEVF